MLVATTFVQGIEELRWILHFLESSSWLIRQLPPDRFHNRLNFDDHWVIDGSTVSDTEPCEGFTPGADPNKIGTKFGSLDHGTTMTWDADMSPIIGEAGELRRVTARLAIQIRCHCYEEAIGKQPLLFYVQ